MDDNDELTKPLMAEDADVAEEEISVGTPDEEPGKFPPTSPQMPTKVAVLKIPSLDDDDDDESAEDKQTGRRPSQTLLPSKLKQQQGAVLDKLFQTPRSLDDELEHENRRNPKSLVFTVLNPKSRQFPAVCFRYFISNVIIVDCIFVIMSTEPALKENGAEFFEIVEGISSTIFLIEFICRVVTITEASRYGSLGAFWGRVRFLTKAQMLVDLCAMAPFFVERITGFKLPTLTFLRTFRLARILKTAGFAQATDAVWRVLYYNRQIMYLSMYVGMIMIMTTSVLLYYCRPQNSEANQEFESILSTMYLATLMLTGQGGPEGDLPWYTKGVVLMTSAFSIGMFAIPVSMLTWGFEAEAERCAKRTRQLEKRKAMREAGSSESFSTDEYSTDEEYQKIIAGEEPEEEDDNMLNLFRQLDADGSGSLSLKEFIELMKSQQNPVDLKKPAGQTANQGVMDARISALEEKIDDIAEKVNRLCEELVPAKSVSWSAQVKSRVEI